MLEAMQMLSFVAWLHLVAFLGQAEAIVSCRESLGDKLPASAFSVTSHGNPGRPDSDAQGSSPTDFSAKSLMSSDSAWCPEKDVVDRPQEYAEIDLGSLHKLTTALMRGLNRQFRSPRFQLRYTREDGEEAKWRIYPSSDHNDNYLQGVGQENLPKLINLHMIAKRIRIYPLSLDSTPIKACVRVSLYGCPYKDGPLEYRIPAPFGDSIYDGSRGSRLTDGLGNLTDLVVPAASARPQPGSNPAIQLANYVAWQRAEPVTLQFRFNEPRNFSAVRIWASNNFPVGIRVPSKIELQLSLPELAHRPPVSVTVNMKELDNRDFLERSVQLNHMVGSRVTMRLHFASKWIVLGEIMFEHEQANISLLEEGEDPIPVDQTTSMSMRVEEQGAGDLKKGESRRSRADETGFTALMVILVLLSFFLLAFLGFGCFACVWLHRRNQLRKRRARRMMRHQQKQAGMLMVHNTYPMGADGQNSQLFDGTPPSDSSVLDDANPASSSTRGVGAATAAQKSNSTLNLDCQLGATRGTAQPRRYLCDSPSDLDSLATVSMAEEFMNFIRRYLIPRRWQKKAKGGRGGFFASQPKCKAYSTNSEKSANADPAASGLRTTGGLVQIDFNSAANNGRAAMLLDGRALVPPSPNLTAQHPGYLPAAPPTQPQPPIPPVYTGHWDPKLWAMLAQQPQMMNMNTLRGYPPTPGLAGQPGGGVYAAANACSEDGDSTMSPEYASASMLNGYGGGGGCPLPQTAAPTPPPNHPSTQTGFQQPRYSLSQAHFAEAPMTMSRGSFQQAPAAFMPTGTMGGIDLQTLYWTAQQQQQQQMAQLKQQIAYMQAHSEPANANGNHNNQNGAGDPAQNLRTRAFEVPEHAK